MKSDKTRENATESHAVAGGNTRYEAAIDALVGGASITEAARQSGYARGTLSRLKHHNPIFQATLNERLKEAREEVTASLRGLISEVIISIRSSLQHPELSPGVVLQTGLTALPKLFALVAENEDGAINAEALARNMVPSSLNTLLLDPRDEKEVQGLLHKSEAELKAS